MNEDFTKIEDFETSEQIVETNKVLVVKSKTASHNTDPENGFTPLCPEQLPVPDGDGIVDEMVGQNEKAEVITLSMDAHAPDSLWESTPELPQLSVVGLPNVDVRWNRHCVSGTFGAQLIKGLPDPSQYDFFVAKGFLPNMHPYSSCYHDLDKKISTGLIEWYNQHGITTVIVGGLALNVEDTPLCVGHTVIDLANAGFQVILNMGATRGLGSIEGRDKFIEMLKTKYGVFVVSSYKEIELV